LAVALATLESQLKLTVIASEEEAHVNRRITVIGVILGVVAVVCFVIAMPLYKKSRVKAVRAELYERTKALVDKNPQLRPEWEKAMEDNVLTWDEAKGIIERAGEKVDPSEE
jgi:hypothetical protein